VIGGGYNLSVSAPTERKTATWALLALLIGATGIAFAPIFVKKCFIGPSAKGFWRVLLALPLLLAFTAAWGRPGRRRAGRPRPSRWWLLLPGVFFTGDLAIWHWSLEFTTAGNATLLTNFAPIFVSLVAWLWLGERFGGVFVVGLGAALIGAAVVMLESLDVGREHLIGDALALLTAVFYGAYQLSVKRLRDHYSAPVIMTWAAGVSSVLFLTVSLLSRETLLPSGPAGWWMLVGLAVVSHILGQGSIAWALGHLPAGFSSVSLLWQPVCAALLGWWLLKEDYGGLQLAGGAIVLIGIYLARRGSGVERS